MIENCYLPAWQHRGQVVKTWGKDSTGSIEYQFNQQGFRSPVNYDTSPDWAFFGNSIVFGIGVPYSKTLVAQFENSQNYGLSGDYMNHHSMTNLFNFAQTDLYTPTTKIAFFWIDRPEPIESMIKQINQKIPNVIHIISGQKLSGAINLMPQQDDDISGTHPGPLTHAMWAKCIQLLTRD